MPGAADNAEVNLEEEVPLISISIGRGDWIAEAARSYGRKVLATVTNASHAKKALSAGADALIVTGHKATAHGGDVGSTVLIPALMLRFPDSPVVAAGGSTDSDFINS